MATVVRCSSCKQELRPRKDSWVSLQGRVIGWVCYHSWSDEDKNNTCKKEAAKNKRK